MGYAGFILSDICFRIQFQTNCLHVTDKKWLLSKETLPFFLF